MANNMLPSFRTTMFLVPNYDWVDQEIKANFSNPPRDEYSSHCATN